jgi:hypothetical protein
MTTPKRELEWRLEDLARDLDRATAMLAELGDDGRAASAVSEGELARLLGAVLGAAWRLERERDRQVNR